MTRRRLNLEEFEAGLAAGERLVLARAITLVESTKPEDQILSRQLLQNILPGTGNSVRIGITGVPGAGKSTFIEAFGGLLTGSGLRVAVLAVDPSSVRTGGSILGDKTRMETLSRDPNAFIRPSPSDGRPGGVHRMTREAILLCEAAGYEVVIVETVGAGQNEVAVAGMVDFFLILMLPNAGDELQGIKKGVLELADMIAVNKADLDEKQAMSAVRTYRTAFHILPADDEGRRPFVLPCSARNGAGLGAIWTEICDYIEKERKSGAFQRKRRQQQVGWMWHLVENLLFDAVRKSPVAAEKLERLEAEVANGRITATLAAGEIVASFLADRDIRL